MKLEEIQKLCDEATPGPWVHNSGVYHNGDMQSFGPLYSASKYDSNRFDETRMQVMKDAKFIAASRDLMPKLLKVAQAALAVIEQPFPSSASYTTEDKLLIDALEELEGPFSGEISLDIIRHAHKFALKDFPKD